MSRRRIIAVLLALLLVGVCAGIAVWMQIPHRTEPYEYPITPDDAEWAELHGVDEMRRVCQIPEDILSNLTTEALLETVLDYPLMTPWAFNTTELAADNLMQNFNGFAALMEREDLQTVLEGYQLPADADVLDKRNLEFLAECAGIAVWMQNPHRTEPYAYAYPLGSEQWSAMSEGEIDLACRIPDDVLNDLTTEALVRTLSERPDLGERLVLSSDTRFTAERCGAYLDDLRYSGFRELMERKDATQALLDWYEAMPIPESEEQAAWDASFGRTINLELLICCDWMLRYEGGYPPEERERLKLLVQKRHEREPLYPFSPVYGIVQEIK